MNREQFYAFHQQTCARMLDITKKKQADYCGDSPDPFHNLRGAERLGITSAETGVMVRMSDKFARIITLIDGRKPEVVDESLEDAILDYANYLILLAGLIRSKTSGGTPAPAPPPAPPGRLQLRVGGRYRARNGCVITAIGHGASPEYPFFGSTGMSYTASGVWWVGEVSEEDLVEEITQ